MIKEILKRTEQYLQLLVDNRERIESYDPRDGTCIRDMPVFTPCSPVCRPLKIYLVGAIEDDTPAKIHTVDLVLLRLFNRAQTLYPHFTGDRQYPIPAPDSFRPFGTRRKNGPAYKQCLEKHIYENRNLFRGEYGEYRWKYVDALLQAVREERKKVEDN